MKTSRKIEAARIGQRLRATLLSEHEPELQERAEVTKDVLDASLSLITSLATRQAVLFCSQRAFVARHPEFASDPNIKTVRCTTINKTICCTPI
jgi:hypothetical protein